MGRERGREGEVNGAGVCRGTHASASASQALVVAAHAPYGLMWDTDGWQGIRDVINDVWQT